MYVNLWSYKAVSDVGDRLAQTPGGRAHFLHGPSAPNSHAHAGYVISLIFLKVVVRCTCDVNKGAVVRFI